MIKLEPYLTFNGNCEEAFTFYGKIFEKDFSHFIRYKDMPGENKLSDSDMERVLYVSLPINPYIKLMGSDTPGKLDASPGQNVALAVQVDVERKAISIFEDLSEGGQILMQLQKTFWADLYGIVTDKYGVKWNVQYTVKDGE